MFEIIEKLVQALEKALEKAAAKAMLEQQRCNDRIEELHRLVAEASDTREQQAAKQAKAEKMLGRVRTLTED